MSEIKKAGVIGAGVMGSAIAAHLANAGVPVVLMDLAPKGAKNRNAVAEGALERLLRSEPPAFVRKNSAHRVTAANIEDHLNLLGTSPLVGPNDDHLGPRFPDMSQPYDPQLISLAEQVASEEHLALRRGVYVAMLGPQLETKAEYRWLRAIGADAVGMSTVPEVIAARHSGLRVLAISIISDLCIPETLKPLTIEEVIEVANNTEPLLTKLFVGVVKRL